MTPETRWKLRRCICASHSGQRRYATRCAARLPPRKRGSGAGAPDGGAECRAFCARSTRGSRWPSGIQSPSQLPQRWIATPPTACATIGVLQAGQGSSRASTARGSGRNATPHAVQKRDPSGVRTKHSGQTGPDRLGRRTTLEPQNEQLGSSEATAAPQEPQRTTGASRASAGRFSISAPQRHVKREASICPASYCAWQLRQATSRKGRPPGCGSGGRLDGLRPRSAALRAADPALELVEVGPDVGRHLGAPRARVARDQELLEELVRVVREGLLRRQQDRLLEVELGLREPERASDARFDHAEQIGGLAELGPGVLARDVAVQDAG